MSLLTLWNLYISFRNVDFSESRRDCSGRNLVSLEEETYNALLTF